MWSFIHVADAAEATVAAIERGSRGIYNIVDDDPAPSPVATCAALGARAPEPVRVPRFVGRPVRRRGRRGHDD